MATVSPEQAKAIKLSGSKSKSKIPHFTKKHPKAPKPYRARKPHKVFLEKPKSYSVKIAKKKTNDSTSIKFG